MNEQTSDADAEPIRDAEILPNVSKSFAIRDAASANWLVRRIIEARRYAEDVRTWAAAEIRRAERDERFFFERFGGQLELWARAEIATLKGGRRSVCLPAGTVGFRRLPMHLVVNDADKLRDWCRRNLIDALGIEIRAFGAEAELLRQWQSKNCPNASVNADVLKSLLGQHVRNTGEQPDGVDISAEERFFVK